MLKYYLEIGIDINYQHPELLTTPLIEAITYQHEEIVAYLLAQGADPTLKAGFSNDTPLRVAKRIGNKRIVELIKGCLPDSRPAIIRWVSNFLP